MSVCDEQSSKQGLPAPKRLTSEISKCPHLALS